MAGGNYERGLYNQLMEVMERLGKVEREAAATHQKDQEEIRELKDTVARQEKKIEHLTEELERFQSKDKTDSHNSSKPPSSDQKSSKSANEYNGRKKTGKSSGGQKGHQGKTLKIEDVKKKFEEAGIKIKERDIGDISQPCKEHMVLDLNFGAAATLMRFHADKNGNYSIPSEYRSEVTYGAGIKSLVALFYGQGVQSAERIVEMISAISGKTIVLSEGTVFNWLNEFKKKAEPDTRTIEDRLVDYHQVHTDGTNVTVNGVQSFIRNFSVLNWVLYVPMDTKGHKTLETIPFLQRYHGILMHDHETSLYKYGLDHVECLVHLIRYLTKNSEDTGHPWSQKMISLLLSINEYRKKLKAAGKTEMDKVTIKRLEDRYDELLQEALTERKSGCRLRWALKEEKTLLNRMKKYKRNHLLFIHDFDVSFDNNMSERDLRKCKNRQKMSGGFRTKKGKEIFCSILTITETCKRQGIDLMQAFSSIFQGKHVFA